MNRLATGGHIDRASTVAFSFDGRRYDGHGGDTLASALLANGVRLAGRSFKYHRPRGIMTAGPEEPNALVELRDGARREPNTPATAIELFDGLVANSQNRWPSLGFDLGEINALIAPIIPAGFYYKTFMWPPAWWEKLYERFIRRAAGMGRATIEADPDAYDTMHAHCDVLVVGAGIAGLAAARAAAESGARVIVLEQDFMAGGEALLDPALEDWRQAMLASLSQAGECRVLTRTTAFGCYDHGVVGAVERVSDHLPVPSPHQVRQRCWIIRAKRIVLATGALDRLIAFADNDRPGVMLAHAARVYARRFAVLAGRRVVMFTNNDAGLVAARDLRELGADVTVADARSGAIVTRAIGRAGIQAARVREGGVTREIGCDLLCVSGGQNPQVQLASQGRAPLAWNDAIAAFVPRDLPHLRSAGAARGRFDPADAARDGMNAGREAARATGFTPGAEFTLPGGGGVAAPILPLWEVPGGKGFVDLQHDVTADDIRLAHREGYSNVEHAKRYTTHGMATDQGKIGGLTGSAILAEARGEPVAAIGLPTFRPYTAPVSWGALAGADTRDKFKPERRLPLHDWNAANGAVFVKIGLWVRPLVYSPTGDTSWGPVLEEARAVRRAVGINDGSSLGKIDIQGKDAATFLDRVYANTMSTIPVGKARYGLMLREDGIVFDDGTVSCLGTEHFLVTTTTANQGPALEHFEFHAQVVWPELDVHIVSVAEHWAQFAVAGPRSRDTLLRVVEGLDLSNAAFPFMAVASARIAGAAGRIFRISFSGELAYEVAVPRAHAVKVWEAILAAGREFGIRPYGLDALNVLRIEKGHVAGSELTGQTTAGDLGLGKMLKKKGDFIGRALAQRPGLLDPERLALVGVRPVDKTQRLRNGAHLIEKPDGGSLGYLTAACMSAELEGWIGLALVSGGPARIGTRMIAAYPLLNENIAVEIVSQHFVDPENERVRA